MTGATHAVAPPRRPDVDQGEIFLVHKVRRMHAQDRMPLPKRFPVATLKNIAVRPRIRLAEEPS